MGDSWLYCVNLNKLFTLRIIYEVKSIVSTQTHIRIIVNKQAINQNLYKGYCHKGYQQSDAAYSLVTIEPTEPSYCDYYELCVPWKLYVHNG